MGEDDIKQFIFDPENRTLKPAGKITELSKTGTTCGPRYEIYFKMLIQRYLEFHPTLPVAYLVNELASTVSVFAFKEAEARVMAEDASFADFQPVPVLKLIQEIGLCP